MCVCYVFSRMGLLTAISRMGSFEALIEGDNYEKEPNVACTTTSCAYVLIILLMLGSFAFVLASGRGLCRNSMACAAF